MYNKKIVLSDGSVYKGIGFGYETDSYAQIIFNTSVTGINQVLTNSLYENQIVTFTYPLISNYGLDEKDFNEITPKFKGVILKELSLQTSNPTTPYGLDAILKKHKICGIYGLDTRSLTKKIRNTTALVGAIVDINANEQEVISKLQDIVTKPFVTKPSVN